MPRSRSFISRIAVQRPRALDQHRKSSHRAALAVQKCSALFRTDFSALSAQEATSRSEVNSELGVRCREGVSRPGSTPPPSVPLSHTERRRSTEVRSGDGAASMTGVGKALKSVSQVRSVRPLRVGGPQVLMQRDT